MWRIFLTVSLLCWSADGRVTCRDHNNGEVDWYIMYKAPQLVKNGTEGLEYIYIDSNGKKETSKDHKKSIDADNGVLANTLRPILKTTTSMTTDFGFISYSDQPPETSYKTPKNPGHSKGVVMMDKTTTGVWLLHSTPRFPFKRDQNNFWPKNEEGQKVTRNAQTFICVTFNYDQFKQIGQHLLDIVAFTFDDHIPADFHENLQKLRGDDNNNRPQRDNEVSTQDLTSEGGTSFCSFAKKRCKETDCDEDEDKDEEYGSKKRKRGKTDYGGEGVPTKRRKVRAAEGKYEGDLYLTIAETYKTDVRVQTWGGQSGRDGDYCEDKQRQVINIDSLKTDLGTWNAGNDHSKWCVSTESKNHLICIADMNRSDSQYERPGGALCFEHKKASQLFKGVAGRKTCTKSKS